ncbi:MAG: sugar nucleotide-binding protein [Bacteroidota bacterium]
MKIFITGGSGTLGQYLNIELSKKNEILTQYNSNIGNCKKFGSVQFSITDYKKLDEIFFSFKPDVVIHTASISKPEMVDKLPADFVYEVNVNATKIIAALCKQHNSKLIYTSTDLVYAGYRGSMLSENAKLIPISFYSETKLMGEVKIQETFNNYLILRMALLFGFGLNHSCTHFQFMYGELKKGKLVKLFTDQFRTPLAIHEAARMISELIEKNIYGEILNLGGRERLSRFMLGEILCDEAGFNKNLLIKTTMDEAELNYKVADVSMNTEKLQSLGIKQKSCRNSIREILSPGRNE